jgi:hypothetical protein
MVGAIIFSFPEINPFVPKTFNLKKLPKGYVFNPFCSWKEFFLKRKSNPEPFG